MNEASKPLPERGPFLRNTLAALAAAISLASAFGFSLVLRHAESKVSHQQPTPEVWFETPTLSSPAVISQGRALFLSSCAHCHGADATGDEGPDLHDVGVSDRYISNIITHGIKDEMPSFRKKLGHYEIVRLTAYVRSLRTNATDPGEGL
jgi:mono/diheme cytochrome c family protein